MSNKEKQADEILVLQSIFDQKFRLLDDHQYEISIDFELPTPITLRLNNQISTIQYLPPFRLIIHYHDEYPSNHPPAFVLSCLYFSRNQLQQLCQKLDDHPFQGEVCVYDWIDLIRHEINQELIIDTSAPSEEGNDPRALNDYSAESTMKVFQYLINYDQEAGDKQFLNHLQTCLICTEILPGSQCIRLHNCGHFYCRLCLNNYVQTTSNDGNFGEKLRCPENRCRQALLPMEVRQALQNDEMYERYERITLQNGLAAMEDISWCPRCQTAVLFNDSEDTLGMCSECRYTFCRKCQELYHFQVTCPRDTPLEKLKRQREEVLTKLSKIERERRFTHEHTHLREKYHVLEIKLSEQDSLLEEFLNAEQLDLLDTQQCPHCHVQIEKISGCSHMLCLKCNKNFIWKSFERPQSSNQSLFSTDETDLDLIKTEFSYITTAAELPSAQADQEKGKTVTINNQSFLGSAILKRVKPCPSTLCRKINIKVNQDNWIVCQKCRKQFCFLCSRAIHDGVEHFFSKCQRFTPI